MGTGTGAFAQQNISTKGIYIDESKCIQCKKCMTVCPSKVADLVCTFTEDRIKGGLNVACIKCGHCMSICPTKAFHVDGFDYDRMEEADVEFMRKPPISKEEIANYIKNRRSYRIHTDELIPDETIKEILDLTEFAASGHNQHKVKWGVIKGKEKVREMSKKIIDLCGDDPFYADLVRAYNLGKNSLTRSASHAFIAYMPKDALDIRADATVQMTALDYILPVYGLGGTWSGYTTLMIRGLIESGKPEAADIVSIPEGYEIVGTMLVGYPDRLETYLRIPEHREADIMYL